MTDEAAEPAGAATGRRPIVKTGVGLGFGAVAIVALLAGPAPLFALLLLLAVLSAGELFRLARASGIRPQPLVGFAGIAALFAVAYVRRVRAPQLFPAVLAAALGASFVSLVFARRRDRATLGIGVTLLALVYVGVMGSYIVVLRRLPDGFRVVMTFGLMAVMHDTGAFFTGTLAGRRPLARSVSPSKTWEGWLGGTAATFIVGAVAAVWLSPPFSWPSAVVLAILVSVVAPAGDLAESMVKRDVAAKDSGRLLAGQGGVLDVIDSLLFAAPVFFYAFRALTS